MKITNETNSRVKIIKSAYVRFDESSQKYLLDPSLKGASIAWLSITCDHIACVLEPKETTSVDANLLNNGFTNPLYHITIVDECNGNKNDNLYKLSEPVYGPNGNNIIGYLKLEGVV